MNGVKYITDSEGNREAIVIDLQLHGRQVDDLIALLESEDKEAVGWVKSSVYMGELRIAYLNYLIKLKSLPLTTYEALSSPLLVSVHEDYAKASVKIMFVGKETNGWYSHTDLTGEDSLVLERLLGFYEDFDMAQHSFRKSLHRTSPFWRFIYKLSQRLNDHESYRRDFIWTNLSKVDQATDTPSGEILNLSQKDDLALLQQEVSILKPDVVVFLSGWSYDHYMKQHLSITDGQFIGEEKYVERLSIKGFPQTTYRVHHPRYLSLTKTFDTALETIETDVKLFIVN